MITDNELQAFCEAVDKKIIEWYGGIDDAQRIHGFKPTTFQRGGKFARIVANMRQGGSAFCFVDLATGDILKAGSWKAPEPKRHVRGNIRNGAADVSAHGAHYLR